MLEGSLSPYDAGLRIWKDCSLRLARGDHRLDPFVYWASEHEDADDDERREYCEYALKEAAKAAASSKKKKKSIRVQAPNPV